MIGARKFRQYLAYVQRSEVHDLIEAGLRPAPGGRPRALRTDVLLAAMIATFTKHQTLLLTRVHQLLTTELDTHLQRELGIRAADGTVLTLRQVRYLASSITDLYEHTPGRRPDLDDHTRAARAEGFQAVIDQLLRSATTHVGPSGRYAIDESAIESAARGKRRPSIDPNTADGSGPEDDQDRVGRCWDRDGQWGYRTKTYDNKTNLMFGYQLIAFTAVGAVNADPRPLLTEKIVVVAGNNHGIAETIAGLDQMAEAGTAVTEVISDRGFTYARAEDWAAPLAARDIEQVLDMHANDRGTRPHKHGYLMIDGWAHCPSTPEHLTNIARPARMTVGEPRRNATPDEVADRNRRVAEVAEFNRLIAERRIYRFEKHGRTTSGAERMICPARAGKVSCAGCPFSTEFDDVPEVVPPVGQNLPKACAQETITIAPDASLKLRQRDYWGSPEWQASFARRTAVEAGFGLLKSPKTGNVRRGWTHQVGLVKTTLLLAIAVTATNLNQLLSWAKRTGDTSDPITTMNVECSGFVELDEHGNLPAALGPPRVPAQV